MRLLYEYIRSIYTVYNWSRSSLALQTHSPLIGYELGPVVVVVVDGVTVFTCMGS